MSDANNSQADGKKIVFPDFPELWKELYFKTETAWADAFKDFVSTDTFVKMLDQNLTQHLSNEKINSQTIDKLFEFSAAPSKKDLARIAELVISVEEKVDNLDYQIVDNMNTMADSLLMMSDLMEKNQQSYNVIDAQNTELNMIVTEVRMQNAILQEQIAEVISQNAGLIKQMGSIKNQNSEMKTQLTDFKKQNTQLKTQLADMKKQVTTFNQKLTILNGLNDGSTKNSRTNNRNIPVVQAEYK